MTRRSILLCVLAAACSQQQIPTPERSLNRPMDVAAACVWGQGPTVGATGDRYAVPPAFCNNNSTSTWAAGPGTRTFGFIPNSATGELAVATLSEGPGYAQLVDLDSRQPGYNFVPVGRLPVAAQTTSDGCRVMVVNEGSCDLSSVDVGVVANGADIKTELPASVFPVTPTIAGNRILARPKAIAIIPRTDVGARFSWAGPNGLPHQGIPACDPNYPYHAFVAYPACDLVAEINLATGEYVRGVFLHADGTMTDAGPAPSCPVECSDLQGNTTTPAPQGNPEVRPVAIEIDTIDPNKPCLDPELNCPTNNSGTTLPYQPQALYVGGRTSRYVYKLDVSTGGMVPEASLQLDTCTRQLTPTSPAVKTCDPVGISRIRVSPHQSDSAPGLTKGPFVYAVALEGTVRVVSGEEFRECEANADAQLVAARFPPAQGMELDPFSGAPNPSCLPVDEDSPGQLPIRRSLANGPGLRVSGGAIDVTFSSGSSSLFNLSGFYAFVVGSNGALTVINVDSLGSTVDPNDRLRAQERISNQIHDRNSEVPGEGSVNGDPTTGAPSVDVSSLQFAIPVDIGLDQSSQIPTLALIARPCGGNISADPAIHFPDPHGPRYENWTMIYEAGLPELLRPGGNLSADTPSTMALLDAGGRYCARGAMPGDYMEFAGCTDNTQCPRGEACFGAFGGQPGLCLAANVDQVGNVAAPPACLDLVNSRHEYRIQTTTDNTLVLDEKPLAIPLAAGCQQDSDCAGIDLYGAPGATLTHLFKQTRADGTMRQFNWVCDPNPWPGTGVRQCVKACAPPSPLPGDDWQPSDDDCQPDPAFGGNPQTAGLYTEYTGYVCGHDALDPANPTTSWRRCVASRIPREPRYDIDPRVGRNTANECFVVPIAYQVHTGLSFLVVGDRTGYLHNITAAPDGSCVADPRLGPKRIGRLSYNAPRCNYPADPGTRMDDYEVGIQESYTDSTGAQHQICIWNATKKLPDPNPCLRMVQPVVGNKMMVWQMTNAAFEAAIGPASRLDDQGNIGPPAFGNSYGFSFQIDGGFSPLIGITNTSVPSVIRSGAMFPGPQDLSNPWLYIIDSGDQVSPTLGTVLNGQMIRMGSMTLGVDTNTTVQ